MTRPWTPVQEMPDGRRRLTVKRCCENCGRELGDATNEELEAAVDGARLPDVAEECGCRTTIEQLALFSQARDARDWGAKGAGQTEHHPTWSEIDPAGREQYITDATAIVRAIVALGWAPKEKS